MEKTDLYVIEQAILFADSFFTDYCELTDNYVLSNEEIEQITDIETKELAMDIRECDHLLKKAMEILKIERL